MIRMMVLVVVVFTICWLPFNVMMLMIDHIRSWEGVAYMWFAFHWLAMSHTCYNPIIYAYMNNRFRMGFVRYRPDGKASATTDSKTLLVFSILSKLQCPKYVLPAEHTRAGSISGSTVAGNEID
ncbi:UNVERIFIED_CONTAM: hypothetical protein PYX00_002371 [Menopon gallinae]|uniref:G-protein coupled receptors family 1 profile domain-containing protein n=1 Tax=Menopon gallinae TaxID=328185 RepID=A0AAW2IIM5_9NEOP